MTCFGPIFGPSSGCDWTFGSVIQECVERSWGVLGEGGTHCYNEISTSPLPEFPKNAPRISA